MMHWDFTAGLGVVLMVSIISGRNVMRRTAVTLAANWAVNTAFVLTTGIYAPWAWFALIDSASAAAILRHPAGKWQSAIGWTYIAQIIIHISYAAAAKPEAIGVYLRLLEYLGWAQIVLVMTWGAINGGRRIYSHLARRRPRASDPARMGGMAG